MDPPSSEGPGRYGVAWLVYGVGAIVGGLLFLRVGPLALAVPTAAIVATVVAEARGRWRPAARY